MAFLIQATLTQEEWGGERRSQRPKQCNFVTFPNFPLPCSSSASRVRKQAKPV